jgi:uncharacterized protein
MRFWDASAVLALIANQRGASAVRVAHKDPVVALWWGTEIESVSGLCRLKREGRLSEADFRDMMSELHDMLSSASEIEPSESVRSTACRVLHTHSLRAADALQLAAAIVWAGQPSASHGFVCLDQRLRDAARIEGFRVLPEDAEFPVKEEQP